MGRRRAARPRRRGGLLSSLLLLGVLAGTGLVAGALAVAPERPDRGAPPGDRQSPPQADVTTPTPGLDVSGLPVARAPFCDLIDDSAVSTALGAQVGTRTSYSPGDRVALGPGVTDVAHEYGCRFGAGDAEARVWVFAAPVDPAQARDIVREERGDRDCSFPRRAMGFGAPGLTSVCRRADRPEAEVTLRGLFGDAWVSCRLAVPDGPDAALARGQRWCLHVATTLGARP